MFKIFSGIVLVSFAFSCGENNHDKGSDDPSYVSDDSGKNLLNDEEVKYFKLMEDCDISGGFAVINGKCSPIRVDLTINGKVSVSSAELGGETIFYGGIRFKPIHAFPFMIQDENTDRCCEYTLKKPEDLFNGFSISVDTKLKTQEQVSSWIMVNAFAGVLSRSRIELNIFDQKITPDEQTSSNLEQICTKLHTKFKQKHPLANDSTHYWFNRVGSGVHCLAGNPSDVFAFELEDFKRFDIWWQCSDESCYFESLSLN